VGAVLIVELPDASKIPVLAEAVVPDFSGDVEFRIAMTPEDLKRQATLTRWASSGADASRSFPDAKLAEDGVEQVFRRRFADDFADGIDGNAQFPPPVPASHRRGARRPACVAWPRGRGFSGPDAAS